ncbi:MAG TPA: phage tail protein, partial [Polyangiaceae bacterium]
MSVLPSSRSYGGRIWDLVPGWTRWRDEHAPGTGLLHGLVDALGLGLDAVQQDIERLFDDLFVDTCDPKLISIIGDLVGVTIDPHLPISRQRHQVKYAIYLRRRKGTNEALRMILWQRTGYRLSVREPLVATRSIHDPLLSARLGGSTQIVKPSGTLDISGKTPSQRVTLLVDVAWPVRRSQATLIPIGPDVHALSRTRCVGLRRSDGTPILIADDPAEFVGKGRAIEIDLIGADFDRL